MILPDVNVLVYAFRHDAERHGEYRKWLESTLSSDRAFGVSGVVLSALIRIVTHPRIFKTPSKPAQVFDFCTVILAQPNVVQVTPGDRHWRIFSEICLRSDAKGNLIPDAYLAALAIEADAELITTDRDFARFSGLRWKHPLAS